MKPAVESGEVYGTWTYLCTERNVGVFTVFRIDMAMSLCSEAFVLAVIVSKKRMNR